jgi:hypothetical protein
MARAEMQFRGRVVFSAFHIVGKIRRMPWNDDSEIQALRLMYNATVSAHASCARALTEATMRGDAPADSAIEAEAKARERMEQARAQLYAAMARALGSH